MNPLLTCPVCQQSFRREETDAMPFCSRRCQKVDLLHWLNEEIGLPVEPNEEESEFPEG